MQKGIWKRLRIQSGFNKKQSKIIDNSNV